MRQRRSLYNKELVHQDDMTVVNIYTPSFEAPKYIYIANVSRTKGKNWQK